MRGHIASDISDLRRGNAAKFEDVNDHVFYDTLAFSTSLTEYGFFTQPQGSGATAKTRQSTNLKQGSQLPKGQNFLVKAIGFHYIPKVVDGTIGTRVQAFYTVMEESYVQFKLQNKEFEFEAPGDLWLPNVCAVASVTGTQGVAQNRVGDFAYHGFYVLKNPIAITELAGFELRWVVDTGATSVSTALTTLTTTSSDKMRWKLAGTFVKAIA